jgi:hypothetical protein
MFGEKEYILALSEDPLLRIFIRFPVIAPSQIGIVYSARFPETPSVY